MNLAYVLLQQKAEIFNQINSAGDFIKCEALSFVMQLKAFWLRLVGFKLASKRVNQLRGSETGMSRGPSSVLLLPGI